MSIQNYPKKGHVKRVIRDHITSSDAINYFKGKGIIICAQRKEDLAEIGAQFYFNRSDYIQLKERLEAELNYKKSSRINIKKEQFEGLEEALIALNNKPMKDEDNTRVNVIRTNEGHLKFEITYSEHKPSLIDLLDVTQRKIEVQVNEHEDSYSLDFNHNGPTDFRKIKEVLGYLKDELKDTELQFYEISLNELTKENKIKLFEEFFRFEHEEWKLVEIIKLKVKRDSIEEIVASDQLKGINSAVLDGKNLFENTFVKSTLDSGFYFSMATMRLDHREKPEFIDLVIDFKSRPEMCEVRLESSGEYAEDEGEIKEIKKVLPFEVQEELLYNFKNTLSVIFTELKEKTNDTLKLTIQVEQETESAKAGRSTEYTSQI
jgi:hypothetical protein